MSALSPSCEFGFFAARARSTEIAASARLHTLHSGGQTGQFALHPPILCLMVHARFRDRLPEQLQSLVEGIRANAQTLGHLSRRIPPNRDLVHRIPLELVAVIAPPHVGLLVS